MFLRAELIPIGKKTYENTSMSPKHQQIWKIIFQAKTFHVMSELINSNVYIFNGELI